MRDGGPEKEQDIAASCIPQPVRRHRIQQGLCEISRNSANIFVKSSIDLSSSIPFVFLFLSEATALFYNEQ